MAMPIDENLDKELSGEIRRCEVQLEEAVIEGVKYLAATDRHLQAYVYMTRLADYTMDEEKKSYFRLTAGQLMEQAGIFGSAVEAYRKGLAGKACDDNTLYFLNNNLGYSLIQMKKLDEAEEFCRNAIAIDPTRYNAHKNLGLVLQGTGNYVEAAKCFLIASSLSMDPRTVKLLDQILHEHPEIEPVIAEESSDIKQVLMSSPLRTNNNLVH